MKEEIKEIIENVKKCCDITKEQNFVVYQRQDILKLLDYTTNLQEENQQLKDNWNKLKEWLKYKEEHTIQQNNYYSVLNKMEKLEKGDSNE